MKEKHRMLLGVYSHMHRHRKQWFSPNMRAIAVIISIIVITLAYNYFESTYPVSFLDKSQTPVTVPNLMFNAFIAGAVFAMAIFTFVVEGEYFFGLRKRVYEQLDDYEKEQKAQSFVRRKKK
ncbi:MAG: hypothetical protein WC408_06970 [Candidatus Micrarchaeia archaeon]|jgi:hypothetical protein